MKRTTSIESFAGFVVFLAWLLLSPAIAVGEEPTFSREKAELVGRVESFFMHNFRDVTWRKSLEWGDVQAQADGVRSIRYTYEARIWDKETLVMSQVFTFAADGKFVGYKNADGFPKPKEPKVADVTTQKGMIALVEDFFAHNFRDVTARKTIEWGQVEKDAKGNSSIRYKYLATIWGKEQKTVEQVFTFDPAGNFLSVKDVAAGASTQKADG